MKSPYGEWILRAKSSSRGRVDMVGDSREGGGNILKVEPTGLTDGLATGNEKKEVACGHPQLSGLSKW